VPVSAARRVSRVRFTFDGTELSADEGATVASALMANGVRSWRLTRRCSRRRGLFCGIGTCFECLVDVNGESAIRACMRALADGDDVRTSRSVGEASTPVGDADVH
jgi:predicted molibdopterin-dependent oxidoreductase YjgC